MDISYIDHPQLVDAIHCLALDQVGIIPKIAVIIGCADPFAGAQPPAPALLTHVPGNFLVVNDPIFKL